LLLTNLIADLKSSHIQKNQYPSTMQSNLLKNIIDVAPTTTPTLLSMPRLKKKFIENVQTYMEGSKKDRLHYPHHNFVPNTLKFNTSARTTVIQLFRTSAPFALEVAFGHTIKDVLHLHIVDGKANIRCAREIDNTVLDTEAKFTSSWAISKDLLDHYRITIRPMVWPLLLIMEEIHPEAPCPLPVANPKPPSILPPDKHDNQQYAFISARFAHTEQRTFPLSVTVFGNDHVLLLNTIICPREFIKHYASDTHDLKEDDLMRGLDHYIAYPLLKAVLTNKTVVAYNAKKVLDGLQIPVEDINTYIDIKNIIPTTAHYTEFRLKNLAKMYLPESEHPTFPIKTTMIEAELIQKVFRAIKINFVISSTIKNPYSHLINNIKEQSSDQHKFKLPNFPKHSSISFKSSKDTSMLVNKRKSPPQGEPNPYPPKNRKVIRQEDPFAELDYNNSTQDTRTVILHDQPSTSNSNTLPKPFPRPTKKLGLISIKPPKNTKDVNPQKTLTHEEIQKIREQRKPESLPPKEKIAPHPIRPTGPQKILEHLVPLMGMVELNTDTFLTNLEAAATKKECMTPTQDAIIHPSPKNDPATLRMEKIKQYITERETKMSDPGHPSVTPNGYYARATADYDDPRFTWDYFIYIQYFEGDYPKSLLYTKIPPIPKMPDCGIMEIIYVPVQYRRYPLKNLYLISSYITREYRNAAKTRTYSLFTRTIQPPLIPQ